MAEIIYFGTNGCSGHYPIGIDKTLTGAEYEIWYECDNETWINNIRKNPGRHLIKHHGEVYTNYGVPFSVDDDRGGIVIPNCFGKAFIQKRKSSTS